jgi:hypothetical protein
MFYKIYMLFFLLKTSTCNCHIEVQKSGFQAAKQQYTLTYTGKLPKCINENSGLAKAWQEDFYWTFNDGGGKSELYMINEKGRVFDTLQVNNAKNIDWEDITKDKAGNLYIGDFGNNTQARKDLTIYKYRNQKTEKITFHYADQDRFPAQKRIFDCEAFFWANDKLYLFSKSWERNDRNTHLYEISDKEGNYAVLSSDSIYLKTPVTAADISPDGKQFALLTYGKVFVFEVNDNKIDFSKPKSCIKIGKAQTEALVYINNTDFIISNEQRKIYKVELKK